MKLIAGSPATNRRRHAYRGHVITQQYRTHDVRNKTHNGYWWGVEFVGGQSAHGLASRADAKALIDTRVEVEANWTNHT
jgi:hypothetical protein